MKIRILLLLVVLGLAALILPNVRALYEGIFFYLRDAVAYNATDVTPINRAGRYASLYDLVAMRNADRLQYLKHRLGALNVVVDEMPIPDSNLTNLFVRFGDGGDLTVFSSHYDKLFDDAHYQGASDNTAAVSVMLAAIEELARRGNGDHRAFLFTGEEETGLRGASVFVEYARAKKIVIREIINFDNLGRGKLAIRPSAEISGFVFTLPFVGDFAYDGRTLQRFENLRQDDVQANERLTQALLRAQPDLVVYERFTAVSDSNVFQRSGIDTVAMSGDNMYYLEQTWHTYADRIEWLDERNLDRAYELILSLR